VTTVRAPLRALATRPTAAGPVVDAVKAVLRDLDAELAIPSPTRRRRPGGAHPCGGLRRPMLSFECGDVAAARRRRSASRRALGSLSEPSARSCWSARRAHSADLAGDGRFVVENVAPGRCVSSSPPPTDAASRRPDPRVAAVPEVTGDAPLLIHALIELVGVDPERALAVADAVVAARTPARTPDDVLGCRRPPSRRPRPAVSGVPPR
jgi:hypothetical protein